MNFTCRQLFFLTAGLLWCGTAIGGLTGCKPVTGGAVGVMEGQKGDGKIGLPCKLPALTAAAEGKQQISVIVDGSASMLGFAKTPGSRYLQVIKLLDSLSLSNAGGVDYARLDDGGKAISRSEFQQAQGVGFYTGKTNRTADMLNGATASKEAKDKGEKLLAIVTDLQQDDGDIKLTSKKILDNYLRKPGYAVAVWGFRSEFNDAIYPLNNSPKFAYASKDIASGRPFYLLLVGRHESIVSFAKELRAQAGALVGDVHNQLTIFSPGYATQDVVYLGEPKELPSGITAPRSLSLGGFAIDDGNQPMAFLEMKDAEKSKIQYSLPWKLTTDLAAPRSLQVTTSMVKYDAEKKDFVPETSLSKSDFQVISKSDDKKIDVDLEINPAGFTRGLYYAKTDLQAIGLQTPPAWDAWDDPTGKNGAKTEGLKDFLGSLGLNASAVMKEKPLTVARLCHGIQKN
jgi:hypothetical protein